MESSDESHPWRRVILAFLGIFAYVLVLNSLDPIPGSSFLSFVQSQKATEGSGDVQMPQAPTKEDDYVPLHTTMTEGTSSGKATVESDGSWIISERRAEMIRKYASTSTNNEKSESSEEYSSESPKYQSEDENVLNIHVVPHTHDDVGWLKTVDQYYNGWNDTIQVVSVREILTSVVEALEDNPSRTFTYVEIKFFTMWWEEQPESVRERVQKLVRETKQLTFVNGGWCMHDEAATHYIGMIDQTTLGHDFLKKTFDYVPTVGWQLDPFGHSSTQSSIMTYKMGFDALYFGRIDYQDLELRHATKECEGLWDAFGEESRVDDEGDERSIFWGLTGSYGGNYGSPGGYCLDVNCGEGQKSFIDKNHTALVAMLQDFLLAVRQQSDRTKGNNVMLTMGSDFQYQRAAVNFANLDLVIGTIMHLQEEEGSTFIPEIFGPEYDSVNIFYSSPEYYTLSKYSETAQDRNKFNASDTSVDYEDDDKTSSFHNNLRKSRDVEIERQLLDQSEAAENAQSSSATVEWSIKRDDFFPYSDCSNCFWTGYFTSRPSLKRFERVASSFLLAARQVESTLYPESLGVEASKSNPKEEEEEEDACEYPIHQLEDAVGVLQHHDGVSGTSKQHVAYDYAKLVQAGINDLVPCTIRKLKRMLLGDEDDASQKYLKDLTYCPLLNETKCEVSVSTTAVNTSSESDNTEDLLYVVVYNSLASNRSAIIDLPIGSDGMYLVEDLQEGSAETINALEMPLRSSNAEGISFVLPFTANSLPPVGAKVFCIQNHNESTTMLLKKGIHSTQNQSKHEQNDGMVEISNGHFSVKVDTKTGIIRKIGTQEVENLSSWGYYTSFDKTKDAIRDGDDHNSGAYLFRPSTPHQKLKIVPTKNASIVHTSLGTEIHTEYEESWIKTTTRIHEGVPYIEIEYQVGPIPIDDGRGKEVVTRYNTGVKNDATFFTDSNGREFIKRQRNHRPTWDLTVYEPVAGNYYPVNAAIYVEEAGNTTDGAEEKGPSFAIVTDRTQGGGSIFDGTIELMVHRRTLTDDYRGVDEPINETDGGITPCAPYGNATRIGKGIVIRGKHRILVEKTECRNKAACIAVGGASLARSIMDESFADPLVFVASSNSTEEIPFRTRSYSGLTEALPDNVMLITKRLLYDEGAKSYLIRLGHQYGDPVKVDLSTLFPHEAIGEVREMTLSANRDIDDWRNERYNWIRSPTRKIMNSGAFFTSGEDATIELAALDIRTFIVEVQ